MMKAYAYSSPKVVLCITLVTLKNMKMCIVFGNRGARKHTVWSVRESIIIAHVVLMCKKLCDVYT